ncbi:MULTISPECIES: HEAT repeat domain-containing protein [Pseudomonas]|uniref:HEAT repeat domain-containing protein n=1 Tax=Pseudomonas TaxID=286 RepID=UPI000F014F58|nr:MULTISPECIES: HEAT repeat domain-containing protein [Pseudomonas]
MKSEEAIKELIKILEDGLKTESLRAAAAEGLGHAGGPVACKALSKIMKDGLKTDSLRIVAAKALGAAAKGCAC